MAEQESRDPVSRIMNAAWPEYGGNHQTIEFWNDFGEGVQFTLKHQATTDGWQPIETAPKDGTEVLLCDDDGTRVVGFYGKHNHIPIYGWIRPIELWGEEVDQFDAVWWLPIPAAPALQEP